MSDKILRLIYPQWQGGNNPNYSFGATLLQHIVPKDKNSLTYEINVKNSEETNALKKETDEVVGQQALLAQLKEAEEIITKEKPNKIITLGGDCAVSQASFDYLSGIYGKKLGILWLDAHPDIVTPKDSKHAHEMIVTHLLGGGTKTFSNAIKHPIDRKQIFMVGIVEDELREKDRYIKKYDLNYLTPEEIPEKLDRLSEWVEKEGIEYLAVHMDLDVLSPNAFRSIYPGEPGLESFGAAIGRLSFDDLRQVFSSVGNDVEIAGYSVTEYFPWDAMNLNRFLAELDIFQAP